MQPGQQGGCAHALGTQPNHTGWDAQSMATTRGPTPHVRNHGRPIRGSRPHPTASAGPARPSWDGSSEAGGRELRRSPQSPAIHMPSDPGIECARFRWPGGRKESQARPGRLARRDPAGAQTFWPRARWLRNRLGAGRDHAFTAIPYHATHVRARTAHARAHVACRGHLASPASSSPTVAGIGPWI